EGTRILMRDKYRAELSCGGAGVRPVTNLRNVEALRAERAQLLRFSDIGWNQSLGEKLLEIGVTLIPSPCMLKAPWLIGTLFRRRWKSRGALHLRRCPSATAKRTRLRSRSSPTFRMTRF